MSDTKRHLTHCARNTHAIDRNVNNREARPDHDLNMEPEFWIRQTSSYDESGNCAPDNNPFWENGHNPLSSKGN